MQRRNFLKNTATTTLGLTLLGCNASKNAGTADADKVVKPIDTSDLWFDISLAQWSLNKEFFGGELDNLDFARIAKNRFGLSGIEYVNQFFKDKAQDTAYLARMKEAAANEGVQSLLIMIDGEGQLGATDTAARQSAVERHHKWVDAADYLGCHSIRVNAAGQGSRDEVAKAATEGLRNLSEYAAQAGLNVIVENHGGYSSDGSWLASVIRNTGMDNCGTLPDFGNFCIERVSGSWDCARDYDKYKGVRELMPYAKAVSAKTYNFNDDGMETDIDYVQMMNIVKKNGYDGWIGIEYEGNTLNPYVGIEKTRDLLLMAGKKV